MTDDEESRATEVAGIYDSLAKKRARRQLLRGRRAKHKRDGKLNAVSLEESYRLRT